MELTLLIFITLVFAVLAFSLFYRKQRQRASKTISLLQKPKAEEGLPSSYGEDEIVALVKDPYWLYTYWETTAGREQELSQAMGPAWERAVPALRVYDFTETEGIHQAPAPFTEVEINPFARSWYLPVKPERTFQVALGRRLPNGEFVPLSTSNLVTTPRDRISEVIDAQWPPSEELWGFLPQLPGVPGSPELTRRRL